MMRIRIDFDSASTKQVRQLSVALHRVTGDNCLTLGVEGPEGWHGETPSLYPNQFAAVVAELCKVQGVTFAEALADVRESGRTS